MLVANDEQLRKHAKVSDHDGRKAVVKNFFIFLDSWKRRLDYHLTAHLVLTLVRLNWNCDRGNVSHTRFDEGFAIANDVERRTTPAVLVYRSRRDAPRCIAGECWGLYLSPRNRAAGLQAE